MAAGAGATTPPEVDAASDDGLQAMVLGTLGWAVAGVVALVNLARGGSTWLVWVCLAGILLGLGIGVFVWRRHRVYQAHRVRLAAQRAADGAAGQGAG